MTYYPTKEHKNAAKRIVDIFSKEKEVMSILLICSCARGKATRDSCLDICFIVKDEKSIKPIREKFKKKHLLVKEFKRLYKIGKYSHIDLEVTDGNIGIEERDWVSGPDEYELAIGNIFVYSVVLFDKKNHFKKLRKKYLPYYSERLRKKRLAQTEKYMLNNLGHIPLFVKRELYFQSFKRFYDALQEFLQALFIKNKTYPISYDKWIKEQLIEILDKPGIYKDMVGLLEIKNLESDELIKKAEKLKTMADKYL